MPLPLPLPRTPAAERVRRRPGVVNAAAALGLACVLLTSVVLPLAGLAARAVVSAGAAPVAGADAVVVLGSALHEGRMTPLLVSRLERAAAVYRASAAGGRPPLVVVAGGGAGERAEAAVMARDLLARGVPADRLLREDRSRTTRENLELSAALLAARGAGPRVVVVTSDVHVARAAELARRSGLSAQVVGATTPREALPGALAREARLLLGLHAGSGTAQGLVLACAGWLALRWARRPLAGR